ncbi:hypothetical protein HNR74_000333 [Flammeovirga kamogawensis]|nr:hypothetical protein [Flammeovirga kamogawensis]
MNLKINVPKLPKQQIAILLLLLLVASVIAVCLTSNSIIYLSPYEQGIAFGKMFGKNMKVLLNFVIVYYLYKSIKSKL